jgi:hypothetical protein
MPCYRCGTRQVDPDRGESPWKRGVRDERQVLICPDCQASHDWPAELDRCGTCGSIRLARRLGETECRDCGAVGSVQVPSPRGGSVAAGAGPAPGLAEEVELALARILGRAGIR